MLQRKFVLKQAVLYELQFIHRMRILKRLIEKICPSRLCKVTDAGYMLANLSWCQGKNPIQQQAEFVRHTREKKTVDKNDRSTKRERAVATTVTDSLATGLGTES